MCHLTTYTLACEHVHTAAQLCPSSKGGRWCRRTTQQHVGYPPPQGYENQLPLRCPLPECPFEAKGRFWNCCWCGKGWNEEGRCSCIMIIDGAQYRCEHICCETCEAAGQYQA